MKTILFALFFSTSLLAFSNGDPVHKKVEVNTESSQIKWVGKKVTGKHEGMIKVKSGVLEFDDKGILSGGEVTIDMTSITCTDMKGKGAANLVGHLSSDDFFGVEKHPEARIIIKEVTDKGDGMATIAGDITIKGVTKPIEFDTNLATEGYATAQLSIDRTQFGIRYGSGSFFDNLGDKTIKDEFTLDISLMFLTL